MQQKNIEYVNLSFKRAALTLQRYQFFSAFIISQLDLKFFLVTINQKARNTAKKSQTLILLINTRLITPRLDYN